jgi:hypothetical protein
MENSHARRSEGLQSVTGAVSLHLPHEGEADFALEICLRSSFGVCIQDALLNLGVNSLRPLLGGMLFASMQASRCRKDEETSKVHTNAAVTVTEDITGDKRVRVMGDYETGILIWKVWYPVQEGFDNLNNVS